MPRTVKAIATWGLLSLRSCGLKLISLRRTEVTDLVSHLNYHTFNCHLKRETRACISVLHYEKCKNIPAIYRKHAKVKIVMDQAAVATSTTAVFSWYDEVCRAEEAGELPSSESVAVEAEETTSVLSSGRHPVTSSEVSSIPSGQQQAGSVGGNSRRRKSRQGKGSKQKRIAKFNQKMDARREANEEFTASLQFDLISKYGLPDDHFGSTSTPKESCSYSEDSDDTIYESEPTCQTGNLSEAVKLNALINTEMKQKIHNTSSQEAGKSRRALDAYLKILKDSRPSVLSKPLDMSTLYSDSAHEDTSYQSFFQRRGHSIVNPRDKGSSSSAAGS